MEPSADDPLRKESARHDRSRKDIRRACALSETVGKINSTLRRDGNKKWCAAAFDTRAREADTNGRYISLAEIRTSI